MAHNKKSRCWRPAARRGTTYIVVMGAAAMVATISTSGLMLVRLQQRRAALTNDWTEAGNLAMSGIELGITQLNANPNWRTTYLNNVESTPVALGRGTFTFKLVDAALGQPNGDGKLTNNTFDPVRLHGIGRVGGAVRVYSVLVAGAQPLDVLRTAVATRGYLDVQAPVTASAPLSANGKMTIQDQVDTDVEAGSISIKGSGVVNGTQTVPAPAKAMPDPTVFDAYYKLATQIPYQTLSGALLSDTTNPFLGPVNPQGVYSISVPSSKTLQIALTHIKGTLVIECANGANVIVNTPLYWEPANPDYPILLIRHKDTNSELDTLQPPPGFVTEGGQTYPSQFDGLIHIVGNVSALSGSQVVQLGGGGSINGSVIIDEDALVQAGSSSSFTWDPTLYSNPPIGYSTGGAVRIIVGSCQWEAAP